MDLQRDINQNIDDVRGPVTVYYESQVRSWEMMLNSELDGCSVKRYEPTYITVEPLRQKSNHCSLCDVDWALDHVSLDCIECGGYSLSRPCVACDGKCNSVWKRDLVASHMKNRAVWTGECKWNTTNSNSTNNNNSSSSKTESATDTKLENSNNSQLYV